MKKEEFYVILLPICEKQEVIFLLISYSTLLLI